MTKFMIDAYAWIEYLSGKSETARKHIENIENDLFTCSITVGEVVSKFKREGMDFEKAFNAITSISQVIDADIYLARDAGIMHAEMRKKVKDFGLADTFVLVAARRIKSKILTGDEHFRAIKEAVFV